MTVNTVDAPVDTIVPRNSLIKRLDLFHSLSAGLADIKVFTSKICLS
jgi:hypothetical protein